MTRTHRPLPRVLAGVPALLLPATAYARPSGTTVLMEDYYGLNDGGIKTPNLTYKCSGHGDKFVPYYVEDERGYMPIIPGVTEQVGNKVRCIYNYYCPSCCAQFASGSAQEGNSNVNRDKVELGIDGTTLDDYFQYIGEHDLAFLADCGIYYFPKNDMDHYPSTGSSGNGGNTSAPAYDLKDAEDNSIFGLALPKPMAQQSDMDAPLGNWDVTDAWTFYQFYYTGIRQVINKPATADDPAWDTVRDMTRIYYAQRQQES